MLKKSMLFLLVASYIIYLILERNPDLSPAWMITVLIFQSLLWTFLFFKKRLNYSILYLGLSLLAALILTKSAFPLYEDDFYRYFWDGHQTIEYGSPYLAAPENASSIDGLEEVQKKVAFGHLATIYGPVAQALFTVLAFFSDKNLNLFLWLLSIGGMATFLFTFHKLLIQKKEANPWLNTLWVAQHPLLLREWVQGVHLDSWLVTLLILSLTAFSWRRFAICVALMTHMKANFLLLLGLLLNEKPRDSLKPLLIFTFVFLLALLPFWNSLPQYFETLKTFSNVWEMNSGAFRWIREGFYLFLEPDAAGFYSRLLTGLLIFSSFIFTWTRKALSEIDKVFWTLLILILLSPVPNSWYFTWVLPFTLFLPQRSSRYLWLSYCFVPLSYAYYMRKNEDDYAFLLWWNIEHIFIWIFVLLAIYSERKKFLSKTAV